MDESEERLAARKQQQRVAPRRERAAVPDATGPAPRHVTLVLGPPSRRPYVKETMRHLEEKHFPSLRWLRTPDGPELARLHSDDQPQKRVMHIYFTTLFDAVTLLCEDHGCEGVSVMEDTCLLRPDVDCERVAREVRGHAAGVLAYGNRRWQDGKFRWHGTKGVYMTPEWCAQMWIVLANLHVEQYQHADMWLQGLLRQGKARGVQTLEALGGFGHGASMTISQGPTEQRWGGPWLPNVPGEPPLSDDDIDEFALQYASAEVREWKHLCEVSNGQRLKRNDVALFPLVLPEPRSGLYEELGVYRRSAGAAHLFNLERAVPLQDATFSNPPQLKEEPHTGVHSESLWEVHCNERRYPLRCCFSSTQ